MSKFLTDLKDKPAERSGYFNLTAQLDYQSKLYGGVLSAPVGFETNYVTGRKLLVVRRIVQDKMNRAAVIHDLIYETGMLSRRMADDIFLEAMLACNVARWRAYAAWSAVRLVGSKFYNDNK